MFLWAIPGAAIQLIGGTGRQMGVLLATGLLVAAPHAGWLVLAALTVRAAHHTLTRRTGKTAETGDEPLVLLGAGLIAGSSLHDITRVRDAL